METVELAAEILGPEPDDDREQVRYDVRRAELEAALDSWIDAQFRAREKRGG